MFRFKFTEFIKFIILILFVPTILLSSQIDLYEQWSDESHYWMEPLGLSDSSDTSIHREGNYAAYYTFTLNEETNISIAAALDMDVNEQIASYIYLIEGSDANGTIVAEAEGGVTKVLSEGTYTVEVTTVNSGVTTLGMGDIIITRIMPNKPETFPNEMMIDLVGTRESTPSVHRVGSYADYRTFQVEEGMYISISAWFFDMDTMETTYTPYIYILSGTDENGEVVVEGDSIMTYIPAGIYTMELTSIESGVEATGDITYGRAYPWMVPVLSLVNDN